VIIVDAGVLIAATDVDDEHHRACSRLFDERGREFIVPATVVVEVCWMLAGHVSTVVEAEFLDSIAEGELRVEILDRVDYARMSELVTTYGDFPLGMVDASVVAMAERLNISQVATLDHRHFNVVRPRHVESFTLLP
jgi:predicted nucleic acid-binding protein